MLFACAMLAGVRAFGASPPERARLGPGVEDRVAAAAADFPIAVRVVLRGDDLARPGLARRAAIAARQARVIDRLERAGHRLTPRFRFESLSGLAASLTPAAIRSLALDPEVESIQLDRPIHAVLQQSVPRIGADQLQAAGFSGKGIRVAVVDSGVDRDHPDLLDDLVAEQCFCDDDPLPRRGCCPSGGQQQSGAGSAEDDNGHGTQVAGIVTSGGVVSAVGVAPDAEIVAIKVLGADGRGLDSNIDAALDWLVTNHASLGVRIVNLSIGDGGEYDDPQAPPCAGTPAAQAIGLLHDAGVLVFAASGNDGHDAGISEPACIADAIAVGGVYDAALGGVGWCADASCTTTLCSDVSGPDVFVCHTNSGSLLDLLAPDYRIDAPALGGGVAAFGGTSAASPHAAGQAALLLEADPSLDPEALRVLLRGHGPLVVAPDNGLSFRRADVAAALASLSSCGNDVVEFGESCDDANASGADCCSPACQLEPGGSVCDDGDACTSGDACSSGGVCLAGESVDCDDGDPCTAESCDASSGCRHTPIAGCAVAVPSGSWPGRLTLIGWAIGLVALARGLSARPSEG